MKNGEKENQLVHLFKMQMMGEKTGVGVAGPGHPSLGGGRWEDPVCWSREEGLL